MQANPPSSSKNLKLKKTSHTFRTAVIRPFAGAAARTSRQPPREVSLVPLPDLVVHDTRNRRFRGYIRFVVLVSISLRPSTIKPYWKAESRYLKEHTVNVMRIHMAIQLNAEHEAFPLIKIFWAYFVLTTSRLGPRESHLC